MHTFEGKSVKIQHNGGFDGKAIIVQKTDQGVKTVEANCEDLIAFVAEYVRQEKISRLENAAAGEILFQNTTVPKEG